MQYCHYHAGRTLAIAVGCAATGGALAILLADPVMTGNWRLDHVLLPVIVAITIASGHLCGSALRGSQILPALGFALIFLVGTVLTVYSSVGAQKSGAGARQDAVIAAHNAEVASKRADLDRARLRLSQAEAMADREMTGSRCGPRCNDWRLRAKEVAARISQLDGELQGLGAKQVAPSRARPFAEALGVLGFDRAKVETIAATFEPFAFSLLFELTAIVAFSFGFSHCHQPRPASVEVPSEPMPAPCGPRGDRKSRRGATMKDARVVKFVEQFRARHGRDPSIPEMQAAFPGTPTSTAQRYRKGDTSNVTRLRVA